MVAAHGGVACNTSDLLQSTACEEVPCPIHCVWGHWSEWSTCTKECEGGVTYRHRSEVIVAEYGGKQCEGSADEDRGLKFSVRYPSLNFVVCDIYITYTHIISYHIISYHIISYHIIYHIISYHISYIIYHIISYHITSHTHTCIYRHIYTYIPTIYIYFSPQSIQWSTEHCRLTMAYPPGDHSTLGFFHVFPGDGLQCPRLSGGLQIWRLVRVARLLKEL